MTRMPPDPIDTPAVLGALIAIAPAGIRWRGDAWVARRREPWSETIATRSFSVGTIGHKLALERATAWLRGEQVFDQYDGMDLSRVETRLLTLERRQLKDAAGRRPRFELSIPPSKGPPRAWMRIYLGTAGTLTQERLDEAVAALHLRMDVWRQRVPSLGRVEADAGLNQVWPVDPPAQTQLLLSDVLAWTGIGQGVNFLPKSTLDASRTGLYEPERCAHWVCRATKGCLTWSSQCGKRQPLPGSGPWKPRERTDAVSAIEGAGGCGSIPALPAA